MSKVGRAGFSIIELLTVIAIIGILAALIFPVMGTARRKARETQCITNMQEIHRALKLFKNDNGRYPAVLLGFAESGVTVDSIKNGTLFSREYVSTAKVFSCPDNRFTDKNDHRAGSSGGTVAHRPGPAGGRQTLRLRQLRFPDAGLCRQRSAASLHPRVGQHSE